MAKKPAIEITKCGGLKCDNPECDYENIDIKIEEYKDWVEKPCPKCGWSLLTKKDYTFSKWLNRTIRFLNFILPKRDENDTENLATMSVKFKGDEKPEIKVEKYKDLYEKVKNETGAEPIIIGSKEYIEEIKDNNNDDNIYYEVEIRYKNGSINKQYHIKNPEDDIIVCHDDRTSTKEENIYLVTLDNKEINLDISNISEIYLNQIEEGYTEDRYMFWMNLNL